MKAHICHESTMPPYDIFRFLVEKTCIHNNKRWNQDNDNVLKRWHFTNFLLFLFPVLSESVEIAKSALFAFHMLFHGICSCFWNATVHYNCRWHLFFVFQAVYFSFMNLVFFFSAHATELYVRQTNNKSNAHGNISHEYIITEP